MQFPSRDIRAIPLALSRLSNSMGRNREDMAWCDGPGRRSVVRDVDDRMADGTDATGENVQFNEGGIITCSPEYAKIAV